MRVLVFKFNYAVIVETKKESSACCRSLPNAQAWEAIIKQRHRLLETASGPKTRWFVRIEFRKRGYVNVGVLLMAQEFNGKDRHALAEHTDYHLRIYYFPEDVKELGGYGEHVRC